MQKITRVTMACHHMERPALKKPPLIQIRLTRNKTRYRRNSIRISRKTAIKRLPMPASTNSRCTCSGVSMISLSVATMISTYWLEKRQNHWKRLERLLDQCQKDGLKSLTRLELQELGLLYRQAAADLSALREDPSGKSYARYLNLLLSRAHNTIYTGQKSSALGIVHFYRYTYPRIFRRNLSLITTAFLLFVAGGLAGVFLFLVPPKII